MTLEANPSSRIQVRGAHELRHPASCAICGNGTNPKGFVDIGVFYDYEGQVYLCMTCVNELISQVGGLDVEEATFLKTINAALAARNAALEEIARRYDELIGIVNRISVDHLDLMRDAGLTAGDLTEEPQGNKLTNDEPTINREEHVAEPVKSGEGNNDDGPSRVTGSDGRKPVKRSVIL